MTVTEIATPRRLEAADHGYPSGADGRSRRKRVMSWP